VLRVVGNDTDKPEVERTARRESAVAMARLEAPTRTMMHTNQRDGDNACCGATAIVDERMCVCIDWSGNGGLQPSRKL
jgi:hypothetical protein